MLSKFNKTSYSNLISVLTEKEESLFKMMCEGFSSYVKTVTDMENAISVDRFRMEGEDFRDFVMSLDSSRRAAHESAIDGVKIVNRLAERHSISPIFEGDINDRQDVAAFCEEYVKEIYGSAK